LALAGDCTAYISQLYRVVTSLPPGGKLLQQSGDQADLPFLARKYGISDIYPSFESMLAEGRIDVVHILTPPATHSRLTIQAAEAGCHVLVEKPFALSSAEAEAMVLAARRNGVKLAVDYNFLMSPVMLKVANLVAQGQVGRITHLEAHYSFDIRRTPHLNQTVAGEVNWAFGLPLGPLADHVPHPASLLLHLLPAPSRVFAVAKNGGVLPDGMPDELRVLIDTPQATGLLSVSFGTRPDTITLDVYSTQMTLHANLSNMTLAVRANKKLPKKLLRVADALGQSAQMIWGTFSNTLKVLTKRIGPPGDIGPVITAFYRSIEDGSEPPFSGESGKRVTAFVEEVVRQTGETDNGARQSRVVPHSSRRDSGSGRAKVLVTGGTGFLGSHLVNRLVREGHRVRVLARRMNRLEHLPRNVEIAYGDLRDRVSLSRAMEGIEFVYHAGAAMGGGFEEFEESTIRGTKWMLELSLAAGVKRFIHISSLTVYEMSGWKRNSVIDESCPYPKDPRKVGPYAFSKVEAERLVSDYQSRGLPTVIVRPGIIYGPRGKVMFPHIGYNLPGNFFMLVGRGSNLLPLTYIDNTVDAILIAAENDRAVGQAFTIVDDEIEITQKQYLKRYLEATGDRWRVLPVPIGFILLPVSVLELAGKIGLVKGKHLPSRYSMAVKYCSLRYSSSKARKELNWQPKVGLEEGLRRTFGWYVRGEEVEPEAETAHTPEQVLLAADQSQKDSQTTVI
jgi:2-alkyl-3-oxoalkanoate reductase